MEDIIDKRNALFHEGRNADKTILYQNLYPIVKEIGDLIIKKDIIQKII